MTKRYECPNCEAMNSLWPVLKGRKRGKYYKCEECDVEYSSKQLDKIWGLKPSKSSISVTPIKEISGKDFFDLTTTGTPYYDDMLGGDDRVAGSRTVKEYFLTEKGIVFRISWIAPHTYLKESAKIHKSDLIKERLMIEDKLIQEYSVLALKGSKMPLPVLDYNHGIQEGRHRAIVAEGFGLSRMPVLIVTKVNEEEQLIALQKRYPGFY
ncbi:hypothetical protein KAU33_15370 [Candidatus Dependentiae bacterium]|nr:hypothetical protein [Candidatus Dependentiae bacterium]